MQDLATKNDFGTLIKFDAKNPPMPLLKVNPEPIIIAYTQCE